MKWQEIYMQIRLIRNVFFFISEHVSRITIFLLTIKYWISQFLYYILMFYLIIFVMKNVTLQRRVKQNSYGNRKMERWKRIILSFIMKNFFNKIFHFFIVQSLFKISKEMLCFCFQNSKLKVNVPFLSSCTHFYFHYFKNKKSKNNKNVSTKLNKEIKGLNIRPYIINHF